MWPGRGPVKTECVPPWYGSSLWCLPFACLVVLVLLLVLLLLVSGPIARTKEHEQEHE